MTQAEFDEKWDYGRLAPTSWDDPKADEWLQDATSVYEESRERV